MGKWGWGGVGRFFFFPAVRREKISLIGFDRGTENIVVRKEKRKKKRKKKKKERSDDSYLSKMMKMVT